MLKLGLLIVAIPAALYALFLVVMFLLQRKLQYFPSHRDAAGKGDAIFKPLFSAQNEFLGYYRESAGAKKVLLFFHGNGGEALDRNWLAELDSEGLLHIVLAEYPGYGARKGAPTERSFFDSAKQIYDETAKRWKLPVTVMGESMGTSVAAYLASERPVAGLNFIAPFTSAVDVARRAYRFLPVGLLMQDRFETVKYLDKVKVPLRIVHGTLDDVVPVELGKQLLERYPGKEKKLEEVPGYGHNNMDSAVIDSPFASEFRDLVFQ